MTTSAIAKLSRHLMLRTTRNTAPATSTAGTVRVASFGSSCLHNNHTINSDASSHHLGNNQLWLQRQQLRWKHGGKIGHRRETLDEMAHRPEREKAVERRQKNKNRKAAKKGAPEVEEAVPEALGAAQDDDYEGDDALYGDLDDDDDVDVDGEDVEVALPDPSQIKTKMMALVEKLEGSLAAIRGGEPTPELFDNIQVSAYGSNTPLKAVGQVVISSSTLAQISCFDPAIAKEVQKAIQLALNLNPQVEEGGLVKVPLPRVSLETRQQTVKQVQKRAEGCKQRVRRVRHKVMDTIKKGKDGKLPGISKDDAFAVAKELDNVTEQVMNSIKDVITSKSDSIMGV